MKKVLLASTALIASAGFAAADVSISGYAEMGVNGGQTLSADPTGGLVAGDAVVGSMETQFHTDIDVTFTLSGETDSGITFGASVDLDEAGGIAGSASDGTGDNDGFTVFISGDFGTLTMGDTDGALDYAMTEAWVGNAGSISDNETGHVGAVGSYLDGAYDGQILRYDYSFSDFSFAVSVEMDDTGVRDNGYGVGAMYTGDFSGGSFTIGAGYQVATPRDNWMLGNMSVALFEDRAGTETAAGTAVEGFGFYIGDVTAIGVSAAVALDSGLSAAVSYTQYEATGDAAPVVGVSFDTTHIGVGVGYAFDDITVSANYGIIEIDNLGEFSGYGVAAAYDLGGGLAVRAAYGSSTYDFAPTAAVPGFTAFNDTVSNWSLGLTMSF